MKVLLRKSDDGNYMLRKSDDGNYMLRKLDDGNYMLRKMDDSNICFAKWARSRKSAIPRISQNHVSRAFIAHSLSSPPDELT